MFVGVCLLTPLSALELRPIPPTHTIGLFSRVPVFVTAGLNPVGLTLLTRHPRVCSLGAAGGIFLVLPGFTLDPTG